ncbi:hypothetical protein [Hyphomonas sp.]|uniref:hypothetical protein n=1 Tax=Hyphomonas sp. TaxID=87 RepID=UPI00329A4DC5
MIGADRHGRSASEANGTPADLTLLIEDEGLVTRFGRPVPDIAALERRLDALASAVQQQGKRLHVARFDGAATSPEPIGNARVMALCGNESTRDRLLERQIPAYQLVDRRSNDHRRLPVIEAERVVQEALRLPVPRPMSDEDRRGHLLTMPVAEAPGIIGNEPEMLAQDPRADWLVLGETQVTYVESDALADRFGSAGGQVLAPEIALGELQVSAFGIFTAERMLFEAPDAARVAALDGEALPWQACRRGHFTRESASEFRNEPVETYRMVYGDDLRVFARRYCASSTHRIVAILGGDAGIGQEIVEEVAYGLQEAGIPAALVWIAGANGPDYLPRFLWDSELHNLAAIALCGCPDASYGPPWAVKVRVPNNPDAIVGSLREAYSG